MLKAQIKQISRTGEVKIKFSKPLNTENFDILERIKFIEVSVLNKIDIDERINFTWNGTKFIDNYTMTLQMFFEKPLIVSYPESNILRVEFKNGSHYQSKKEINITLRDNYVTKSIIPKQLDLSGKNIL